MERVKQIRMNEEVKKRHRLNIWNERNSQNQTRCSHNNTLFPSEHSDLKPNIALKKKKRQLNSLEKLQIPLMAVSVIDTEMS